MARRGLFLLTVLGVFVAVWAVWSESAPSFRTGDGTEPIFPALAGIDPEISGLNVETRDYTLQLKKAGNNWTARSHADYPVRSAPAMSLVSALAAMRPLEAKTRNETWYPIIGVEDRATPDSKSRLVTITGNERVLAEALVGKVSASLGADLIGGTFVRKPGDVQSWLVTGVAEVPGSLQEWFEPLFNIPGPSLSRITITEGDEVLLAAVKPAPDASFQIETVSPSLANEGRVLEQVLMRRIAGVLVSAQFNNVRPASGVAALPNKRKVAFVTSDGLELTAEVSQLDTVPWVVFHASAPPQSSSATLAAEIAGRTEGWAFQLPQGEMLALLTKAEDLLMSEQSTAPQDAPGRIITDPAQLPFQQPGAPGGR